MIELLVKARDTHGPYGKGHVIDVKNSPCPWSRKECLPLFLKIRVDTDMANVRHLKSEQLMREHKITQVDKDFVVTINNAPALTFREGESHFGARGSGCPAVQRSRG